MKPSERINEIFEEKCERVNYMNKKIDKKKQAINSIIKYLDEEYEQTD